MENKGKIVGEWFKKSSLTALQSFSGAITVIMIVIPSLFSMLFGNAKGGLLALGSIFNLVINMMLKFTIKQKAEYPIGISKKICTLFEDYIISADAKSPSTDFRMPSAHTQTIGFVFGFFLGRMIVNKQFKIGRFFILLLLVALVSWSRYNVKCHTMPQVVVGAVIGTALGIGYYYMIRNYYELEEKAEADTENLCLASDDNEYKCDVIKDGYVIRSGDD